MGVAITPIPPPGYRSAASFNAGSMPTMIISGYFSRRSFTAAEVAVLQAMTRALSPRAMSFSATAKLKSRTSALVRMP